MNVHKLKHNQPNNTDEHDEATDATDDPPMSLVRSLSKKFDKKNETVSPQKQSPSPKKGSSPFKKSSWPPNNRTHNEEVSSIPSDIKPMSMMQLAKVSLGV